MSGPIPLGSQEPRPLRGMGRRFGDLRVRPKLMVLHNLFFLALACGVYYSLIPLVESRLQEAQGRESNLIFKTFAAASVEERAKELDAYGVRSGSSLELGIPPDIVAWLDAHPGEVWRNPVSPDFIYKKDPPTGRYLSLRLPGSIYAGIVESAKLAVFVVLGAAYILAVLLLELSFMPRYVYQPLALLLAADRATRAGRRGEEIIPAAFIPGDEIGQIMSSRNETVLELRRHEDELEAAKRSLEAQDRLASLGLLSASVAHEMNSPLAVLHGSIEKLLETVGDPGAQERLKRMVRVTERLRTISAGLLEFARARPQELAPVGVAPLVEEAWALVSIDEKAAGVRLELDLAAGARAWGNAGRLVQVFVNLLRNALHAVPPDGWIRVTAAEASMDGKPAVRIRVEDNGPGIAPEVLPEIFEAFVTTRLDARGTGLGLTVAEGIVHQHGGSIAASNCPAGGARLEVVLPAAPPGEPA